MAEAKAGGTARRLIVVARKQSYLAQAALELLGVIDNRRVRGPLVALDDDEVSALRAGLAAAGPL